MHWVTTAPDWDNIDCVFLDMDGTLLDLIYDNHVWNELVPAAYASKHQLALDEAKQILLGRMREIHGTIDFYSFEYWTDFTGIDLVATHRQATKLLAYRPGARDFLRWLRARGIATVLATNAHPDSIMVKDKHTQICAAVDAVVSSHRFAAPKEDQLYWQEMFEIYPYNPARCLFVDDNEPVLDAARHSGIAHLLAVATPDSSKPERTGLRYPSFNDFKEIRPADACYV